MSNPVLEHAQHCVDWDDGKKPRNASTWIRADHIELARAYLAAHAENAALRKMLESARCPTLGCVDGSIQSTGPDPQDDACPWCHARHDLLSTPSKNTFGGDMTETTVKATDFLRMPLTRLQEPQHGFRCVKNHWWAVTEENDVLFYKRLSSPQCNSSRLFVEGPHAMTYGGLKVRAVFVPVAFVPPTRGD